MSAFHRRGPRRFSEAVATVRNVLPTYIIDTFEMPAIDGDMSDVPHLLFSRFRELEVGEFLCMVFMFRLFDEYFPELDERFFRVPLD